MSRGGGCSSLCRSSEREEGQLLFIRALRPRSRRLLPKELTGHVCLTSVSQVPWFAEGRAGERSSRVRPGVLLRASLGAGRAPGG